MGTRNLTMVIKEGKPRIAQYGQWDGYPTGAGYVILDFLKKMDRKKFLDQLNKCRFANSRTPQENYTIKYNSRDHGPEILNIVYDSTDNHILLTNKEEFIVDGLFCEWAYVIDLDANVLQVFKGFEPGRLTKEDRFYKLRKRVEKKTREFNKKQITEGKKPYKRDSEYCCKLFAEYKLHDLPEKEEFKRLENTVYEENK